MRNKLKILLIEDNPGDVRLIREMLKESGIAFELVLAERLSEAQKEIANNKFDAILVDLALPDSWGIGSCISIIEWAP